MIKKLLSFSLALIMMLSMFSVSVLADQTLVITIDGKTVATDVAPFIDANNRTMVPVRFITESLGAEVKWEPNTRTVTVLKGSDTIVLVIDSRTITFNGTDSTMDTAAIIRDGRTFVPVRYIAEAMGLGVDWSATTRTVVLTTGGLDAEAAREVLQRWLADHPDAQSDYILALEYDEYSEGSEEYYLFSMENPTMYWANFIVHKRTGELLFLTIFDGQFGGTETEPLDEWYERHYE